MIWNCEGKKKKIPCAIQKTRSAQNLWSDFIFFSGLLISSLFCIYLCIYLFIYLFSHSFFSVTKKKEKPCDDLPIVWLVFDVARGPAAHEAQKFFISFSLFSILTKRNRRRAAEETSHSQPKIGVHKNPLIFSAISSLLFLPLLMMCWWWWWWWWVEELLQSYYCCGKLTNVKDFFLSVPSVVVVCFVHQRTIAASLNLWIKLGVFFFFFLGNQRPVMEQRKTKIRVPIVLAR